MSSSNSPLRYPGGKTALSDFLASLITVNQLEGGVYAEPYCGGAGAALKLLYSEYVDRIILNDADRCIYAFWKAVSQETEDFIRLVKKTAINITEWNKQKEIYQYPQRHSILRVGFATFYLNRCNRSGILMKAGPIGGKHQTGKWKIDARFNKSNLIKRIEKIALYKDRIDIHNLDAILFLKRLALSSSVKDTFVYLDPPYYEKGRVLYLNCYKHKDHQLLAKFLKRKLKFQWIMSYDDVQQIRELYKDMQTFNFYVYYSANKTKLGNELLIHNGNLKMTTALMGLKSAS